jgi:polyhydroxybutyrate depolymerase
LVALHGTSSDGAGMIGTAHLFTKATFQKFIVVAPDGLKYNLTTFFNAGEGWDDLSDGTDDTGFISKLIDDMIANYSVDPKRVYVMGHSNGGMMAYRLAVEIPEKIAAIASNSGTMVYENAPITPVPIIHMHGLEDPKVPYEGGWLPGNDVLAPSVESVMELWRVNNGCDENATQFYYKNNSDTYGEIIGRNWTSPDGKHDVVLYTFEHGGHGWRNEDDGLKATDVFWDFLKKHTL